MGWRVAIVIFLAGAFVARRLQTVHGQGQPGAGFAAVPGSKGGSDLTGLMLIVQRGELPVVKRPPRTPAPQDVTAAALSRPMDVTAIAQPVVKVLTVQDIASIKVATTEDELLAALGQPSSRLSIPDDDGHLRQTCHYGPMDGRSEPSG